VLPQQPHVICLTEHHSKKHEIETLSIDQYILGVKFCRQSLKHGGTGIFVQESLTFTNIDLQKFCVEQDLEMCGQIKPKIHCDIYNMYLQSANWQFCTFHERFKLHSKSVQQNK
jgi:hypothetical protein